jgi:hypothetical protein
MINNYQNKYLKYKKKYLELKKLLGGSEIIPKNNDENMLIFIKKIVEKNASIRFSEKPYYEILIKNIHNVEILDSFTRETFNEIFSKGTDRLYNLINYITTNDEFISKANNCKALIVAQYIIINQVFGDGNHRTAIFVLENYSTYTRAEIITIMDITERIHKWDGSLNYLWTGVDPNRLPKFELLYNDSEISGLLKKM